MKDQLVRAVQLKRLYSFEEELMELCSRSEIENVAHMPMSYMISVIRERVSFYGVFMLYERVNELFRKLEKVDDIEDQVNKLRAESQYLKYKIRYGDSMSEFFASIDPAKGGSLTNTFPLGKGKKASK